MSISEFSIKNPFAIIAAVLLVTALGLFGYFRTASDLFPNTTPPQVVVVTVWKGASASNIADKITQIIEKELNGINGLKNITSTSRDEVSSINAEFKYSKPIGEAVLDVQNAVSRIRAGLPNGILEPRIYKITDATKPLMTIALSAKKEGHKTLSEIRLLASNEIEDKLLNVEGVSSIDIFGANKPEIKVYINRAKLAAHNLNLKTILGALNRNNISSPAGIVYSKNKEYLMNISGEFKNLNDIRNVPISYNQSGLLRLSDVAEVKLSTTEQRSIYHGNGKPAIAINVLRGDGGDTSAAIGNVIKFLPQLKTEYSDIDFFITDNQAPVIKLNVDGMRSSLIQAIFLTIAVIFIFLADMRTALIVSVSIPTAFLFSLVILWFSPFTLNMVTLSGLIISVGMVVDASIVVLENIFRHYTNDKDKNAVRCATIGAKEVALATTAGMLTTVIVLVPVMNAGGYTQQTMRPLNLMISATLFASLFSALTIVPLMASRLLSHGVHKRNFIEKLFSVTDIAVEKLSSIYLFAVKNALRVKWLVLLLALVFLMFTMKKIKPLLGGELMPKMDTGIVNIVFETPADYTPEKVDNVLSKIEKQIYKTEGVTAISSTVGSEPGEISFGGGATTTQQGKLKVTLVNRLMRKKDIWEIQKEWRKELAEFAELKSFQISEYGATPLSTTRAPLDIIISGQDVKVLDKLATKVLKVLDKTPGLMDVKRSWNIDKSNYTIKINQDFAQFYNVSQNDIAEELNIAIKGVPATKMRLDGNLDIPVNLQYENNDVNNPDKLKDIYINSAKGMIPLRSVASLKYSKTAPFITREKLLKTIDITGINVGYTIGQVTAMIKGKVGKIEMPLGYKIKIAGSAVNMATGQKEMGKALVIGISMLFILLIAMFKSFLHPFTIMSAIPLAVAGGFWGLLIFDKPMCKPAMMGLIFLAGTIVNNSILLLDFIIEARKNGMSKDEAILHSIKLRLRPILITTVSTVVGLIPLIFEMAVGLERMSPLGIVAASGLIVGTFLTILIVPIVYSVLDSLSNGVKNYIDLIFIKNK